MNRERIHNILSTMRQRIELEDDDFHYDALLEAEEQLGVVTDLYEAVRWVLEDYQDKRATLSVSTHTQLLKALAKARL